MSTEPEEPPDEPAARRPSPATIGELRASGWRSRSVKAELRSNLLVRLAEGRAVVPGVIGYADSVLPAIENAILAGQPADRGLVRALGDQRPGSRADRGKRIVVQLPTGDDRQPRIEEADE